MPKYDVHVFLVVRVKVSGVDAVTQTEAIEKARNSEDWHARFNNGEDADWAEDYEAYVVDALGASGEELSSTFFGDDCHMQNVLQQLEDHVPVA